MIALQFSLSDEVTFGKKLKQMNEIQLRRVLTGSSIFIIVFLSLIYWLAEAELGDWFIPLIFTIFSQLTIIAPQVIYAMLEASGKIQEKEFNKAADLINTSFIVLAWIILVGATLGKVYKFFPSNNTQEFATYLSVMISAFGQWIAWRISKSKEHKQEGEE